MYPRARLLCSAYLPRDFPDDSGCEVAFAGRSNSGKSSALNAIANRRGLARTSKTPGRTQLINFFEIEPGRRLVDLPGYGYAKVPEPVRRHWRVLVEAYFERRRSLAGLMLIMDARRPLTEFDQQMLAWAGAQDCPVHVLLNKADKLGRGQARAQCARVQGQLEGRASVQLFSALKRTGLEPARKRLEDLLGAGEGA